MERHMVRRINKSLFNLCRERYNKIAGKVQKLQFIYVIYGRMKELTEQGRVNKTAMTGHTIMGILLALVNWHLDRWWQNGFAIGKIRRQKQSSIFWGLDLQYIIRWH